MPSPFPGMDPYLEGYFWSDVHHALANKIRQMLVPLLRPHYTARLEVYLVEDTAPQEEIGILYPDVEVLQVQSPQVNLAITAPSQRAIATTPAPLTLPLMLPVEVRIPTVEIRDTAQNRLITCIEILFPVNKREPAISDYRRKRQRLYQANVHLIEVDLLRRGTRPFNHPRLPAVPYLITLTRARSGTVGVWPVALADPLPAIPVPLQEPDAEVPLELGVALSAIYDEAAYDLSIDYSQPPPPPVLSEAEKSPITEHLLHRVARETGL